MSVDTDDVPKHFKPNELDSYIITQVLKYEGTPHAIAFFSRVCDKLTDYSYWFMLGLLWVSYSGKSDLSLWKQLFRSDRPRRSTSLMKPSEFEVFKALPDKITVYRAHRPHETDWISYTLSPPEAARFARERGVSEIVEYRIRKKHALALFLRRGEQEIIMLEPHKSERVRTIKVVIE